MLWFSLSTPERRASYIASPSASETVALRFAPVGRQSFDPIRPRNRGNFNERATGTTAERLCAEAEAHADEWRLSTLAARVTASNLLVMGAREEGLEAALQPLVLALRGAGAPLETRVLPTDHAYSDQRVALADAVVRWLGQHGR